MFICHQVTVCVSSSWLRRLWSGQSCPSWWPHQNRVSHWTCTNNTCFKPFNTAMILKCEDCIEKKCIVFLSLCNCTKWSGEKWVHSVSAVLIRSVLYRFEAHVLLSWGTACVLQVVNIIVLCPRCSVFRCCLCGEFMFPGGQWHLQLPLPSHTAHHAGLPLSSCCYHALHSRWNNWVSVAVAWLI